MTTTFRDWTKPQRGVDIRAALVEDVPYEASPDKGVEIKDLWIMFVSIQGQDRWLAYGIVDTLTGEPEMSLRFQDPDLERLKKLSILIGDHWMKLEYNPMPFAQKHRRLVAEVEVVIDDVLARTYEDLTKERTDADWKTMESIWRQHGMKLSLN